jgi:benzoyl-CoA reductase subunit C
MVSEFLDAYRNRHELAEGWKKEGRKICGFFCNYVPEELISAAGAVPVRIRGGTENIEVADAHLPTFCCSYIRSVLELALKGRYSYLDGVVFPKSCDMTRVLPGIWKRNVPTPFQYMLPVPGRDTDEAVDFLTHELDRFRQSLAAEFGGDVGDEALGKSIKTYNENRALVGRVYELALSDTSPLSGSDMFGVLISGMIMPKDQHNAMLRKLLDNPPAPQGGSNGKVRLMIVGNTFETADLLRVMEECGAQVVIDDIDTGTRYYETLVDESLDPLRGLAVRYLRKTPCPCKHPTERRLERILALASEYRVKGVVLLNQKYCDSHLYDRPWIESRLKENGLQVLFVEHSDIGWVGGKFKTMVEAFLEMVE